MRTKAWTVGSLNTSEAGHDQEAGGLYYEDKLTYVPLLL